MTKRVAAAAAAALVLVVFAASEVSALSGVRLKVPQAIVQGKDAVFQCIYNLEGGKLYSLKWYRHQREFFRYSPNDVETIKQFKIPGLNVVESMSNSTHLVIQNVSSSISGPFSCEVTEDQPSFYTDMQTAEVRVVELPSEDPSIVGLKSRYKSGDILKANCTSYNSNPAANLTWYINGQSWEGPHVQRHKPRYSQDGRRYTAHISLRIQISKDMFKDGHLKIRCSASIYDVYLRITEKSVEFSTKKKHIRHNNIVEMFISTTTTTTERPPAILWFFTPNAQDSSTQLFGVFTILRLLLINNIVLALS